MLDLIEAQKLPGHFSLQTLQNTIGLFLTKPQHSSHDCTYDAVWQKICLIAVSFYRGLVFHLQ